MTSLRHESRVPRQRMAGKGAVCAQSRASASSGGFSLASGGPPAPRTGLALHPDAGDDAFVPPSTPHRSVCALLYNPQEGWRDSLHGLVQ